VFSGCAGAPVRDLADRFWTHTASDHPSKRSRTAGHRSNTGQRPPHRRDRRSHHGRDRRVDDIGGDRLDTDQPNDGHRWHYRHADIRHDRYNDSRRQPDSRGYGCTRHGRACPTSCCFESARFTGGHCTATGTTPTCAGDDAAACDADAHSDDDTDHDAATDIAPDDRAADDTRADNHRGSGHDSGASA